MYRLGFVEFTNTFPLMETLRERDDVVPTLDTPRRLAEGLRAGRLDAAIAPIAEHVMNPERYQILPGACIGCLGEVQSVRLYSRQPFRETGVILADPASLTSNLLTRVLLHERCGTEPEMIHCSDREEFKRRMGDADTPAAVVIGDLALQMHNGLFAHTFEHSLDLGEAWFSLTGLPFVFAAWLAPADAPVEPLASILSEARDAGVRRLPEMARRAATKTGLPVEVFEYYYRNNVTYHLDDAHQQGLARFEQAVQTLLEIERV